MAITAITGAIGTTSTVVTLPGTITAGSRAFLELCYDSTNSSPVNPSGWTEVYTDFSGSSNNRKRLLVKSVGPSDQGTTVTITRSSAGKLSAAGYIANADEDWANLTQTLLLSATAATSHTAPVKSGLVGTWHGVMIVTSRGSANVNSVTPPAGWSLLSSAFSVSSGASGVWVFTNLTDDSDGSVGGGSYALFASGVAASQGMGFTLHTFQTVSSTPGAVTLTPVTVSVTTGSAIPQTPITQLAYPAYIAHRGGASVPGPPGRPESTIFAQQESIDNDAAGTILDLDAALIGPGGGATDRERIGFTHYYDDLDGDGQNYIRDASNNVVTGTLSSHTVAEYDTWTMDVRSTITGSPQPMNRWPEVSDFIKANPSRIFAIETKTADVLTPLIDNVIADGLTGQVLAHSFDYSRCTTMAAAGLNVAYLISGLTTTIANNAYTAGIRWVFGERSTATANGAGGLTEYCTLAHAAGLKVGVYTVNSDANRDAAIAAGADIIITDRPDIVNNAGGVELSPVTVTVSAPSVAPIPQPVTITLTPITRSVSVPAVAPVPQPVAITLAPVVMTTSARPLTATPGVVTMTLAPAAVSAVATPLAPAGAGSVALSPVQVAISARPVVSQPGQVTTTLTPVAVSATVPAVTPNAGSTTVTLTPVSVVIAAPTVIPVPEPVAIALTPVLVAVTVTSLTSAAGEITVTLTAVQVVVAAVVLSASGVYTGPGSFAFTGELTAPTILSGSLS